MNQLTQFLAKIPKFKEIQESPVVIDGNVLGYCASAILTDGYCIGSGFSIDSQVAKQIALSEALERQIVFELTLAHNAEKKYLLDEYPSTCGFSVGLDKESTKQRAVAEAVERWLISKWIDDHYFLPEQKIDFHSLTSVDNFFANHFSEIKYFTHQCKVQVGAEDLIVSSIITIGLTEHGAFYGGKSAVNQSPSMTSALVESWRHLRLSEASSQPTKLVVVKHYSKNKESALAQIDMATKTDWPQPKIRLLVEIPTGVDGYFCFRCLCENFKGWHGQDINRFIY